MASCYSPVKFPIAKYSSPIMSPTSPLIPLAPPCADGKRQAVPGFPATARVILRDTKVSPAAATRR